MIDIESKVVTAVRDAVHETYPDVFVSGEYLRVPNSLPAVSVMEYSNFVPVGAVDSGAIETYARVMYQMEVYAADKTGRKSEAKKIMSVADEAMAGLGFRRIYYSVLPNVNNATIYRLVARYQGSVLRDGSVAR